MTYLVITAVCVVIPATIIVMMILRFGRAEPTTPNHARLIAKPGVTTLDLVTEDGVVRAKVILYDITQDYREGTTVLFKDYAHFMKRNTYHG